MAKSTRTVPRTIADEATRRYLQDLRDDLESVMRLTSEVVEAKVSDGQVLTYDGVGAYPIVDGFALSVVPTNGKIRLTFNTGTSGKKSVKFVIVKG